MLLKSRRASAASAMAVAVAVAVGACTTGGSAKHDPLASPASAHQKVSELPVKPPAGWSAKPVWSDAVTWSAPDDGSGPADGDGVLMAGAASGFVVQVGPNLVDPAFDANRVDGAVATTLQFRDAATGKVKTTQKLPIGHWYGMSADTANGKPVLVVHYQSTAPDVQAANNGKALNVTQVFDADGAPVWTSGPDAAGSLGDAGFPAFTAGYWLRADPAGGQQVMDMAGHVVLQTPAYSPQGDAMSTLLAHGLVVTEYADQNLTTYAYTASFTVYDPARGARKVGEFTEPTYSTVDHLARVLAASGSKVLISWPSAAGSSSGANGLTVFDTATGTATAPVQTSSLSTSLAALADTGSGNVLVYSDDQTGQGTTMIHLADGKVLWQQATGGLFPVSMHRGTLYGIQIDINTHRVTRLTVDEATGTQSVGGYQVAPVAYAGDQAVFAIDDGPTAAGGAILLAVCTPAGS